MNIVQMILKLLTSGDTLNKIASALGIGQEQAGKAVGAAVPTLLAALAGVASKPGGGADLANVLAKQDTGMLDNPSSLFSGGGAAAAQQGSNSLGSLLGGLGGNAMGQIGSVLSRFTGVNEGCHQQVVRLARATRVGRNQEAIEGSGCRGHRQNARRAEGKYCIRLAIGARQSAFLGGAGPQQYAWRRLERRPLGGQDCDH